MATFPIGSSVLLKGLVKGAHLNGKKGMVMSLPNVAGRQEVYVFEAQKSMAIKPTNLAYEPRALSSLSVSEMKGVLLLSTGMETEPKEWAGMTRDELQRTTSAQIATEDPEEIAALVARASSPSASAGGGDAAAPLQSADALRQGAERVSHMNPDEIRRQAATMKSLGPAGLRAMNPQMATLTDEQISVAIAQMEAVATNPGQLQMMADQMKNMSESDLRQAVSSHQRPAVPQPRQPTAAATPSSNAHPGTTASKSQLQQATQQMSSMTPEQLRQQARMLKSMPRDALRRSNPQMAHMTDAQIDMSIAQLEQMADNPDMIKMAADQMKHMTAEQYESMKDMVGGLPPGGTAPGSDGAAAAAGTGGLPADPAKIMEALLASPDQLNAMIKTMKQNPDMLKQMMASQMGIATPEAGNGGDEAQRKQMEKVEQAIDSFVNMDEKHLDRYLKVANTVQKVSKPMLTVFAKAKGMLGVSAKTLIVSINLMALASGVLLVRWWKLRHGGDVEEAFLSSGGEGHVGAVYEQSEF